MFYFKKLIKFYLVINLNNFILILILCLNQLNCNVHNWNMFYFNNIYNQTEKDLNKYVKFNLSKSNSNTYLNGNEFNQNLKLNYFCNCPPNIQNTYHSLQDILFDNQSLNCIYSVYTKVKYKCNQDAKLLKTNLILIDTLICKFNLNTNQSEWYLDLDKENVYINHRKKLNYQFLDLLSLSKLKLKSKINFQFIQCEYANIKYKTNKIKLKNYLNNSIHTLNTNHFINRRSISIPMYIEIMVVVDETMKTFHGNNLKNYLFAIMSKVTSLFKDSTIGNNINISIVQFYLLDNRESKEVATGSANEILKKFCKWQYELKQHFTDEHPLYYDTAILITRKKLCNVNDCIILGQANLASMCNPRLSCSIVKDIGLLTSSTIAHELGHVLSMPHDQSEECKKLSDKNSKNSQISSEEIDLMGHIVNGNLWKWSSCSAHYLTEFLNSEENNCLLNKPLQNLIEDTKFDELYLKKLIENYSFNIKNNEFRNDREKNTKQAFLSLPNYFNIDVQCQLIFGPKSKACSYQAECKILWCTIDYSQIQYEHNDAIKASSSVYACKTYHLPWVDGTPCDLDNGENVCKKGKCISKEFYLNELIQIDGGWSEWLPWSNCTRACGGGIRSSQRICNNPTPKNGEFCLGERIRYESCNIHKCPAHMMDFREEQCLYFNNKKLKSLPMNVTWIPHYAGISRQNSCKLYCIAKPTGTYYLLKNKVIDGTDCMGKNKCVNGKCVDSGCDNIINSNKVFDLCGVCGGDNSTCTLIAGKFTKNEIKYGYNQVVVIPAGAMNVIIKVVNGFLDDGNSLAVRSWDGTYLINGNNIVSPYEEIIWYNSIKIEYTGTGLRTRNTKYNNSFHSLLKKKNQIFYLNGIRQIKNRFVEMIKIDQKLKNNLYIEVLCENHLMKPEIIYQYTISKYNLNSKLNNLNSNYQNDNYSIKEVKDVFNLNSNLLNNKFSIIRKLVVKIGVNLLVPIGSTVHILCPPNDLFKKNQNKFWFLNKKFLKDLNYELNETSSKSINNLANHSINKRKHQYLAENGSLKIINFSKEDVGVYRCWISKLFTILRLTSK